MKNIIGIVVSLAYVIIIIALAKVFEKKEKEISRKFIHIMLGNWWFIAMYFFDNAIYASIAPIIFIIVNYISYKKNLIKVMERDNKEEQTLGTVYYAISLLIVVIVTYGILHKPELGIVPILAMAYGDGLAAVVSKKIKSKEYKIGEEKKTIAGSITMFIVSFIVTAIYLYCMNSGLWVLKAAIMSLVLMVVEAVSVEGSDNISIPLVSLIMLMVNNF